MNAQQIVNELEIAKPTVKVAAEIIAEEVRKKRPQNARAIRFWTEFYKYKHSAEYQPREQTG